MAYIDVGNGPGLVANSIVTLTLTWIFSSVRVYVRAIMMKIWKIEDWLFVGSQISFTILSVCALMAAIHGNGQRLTAIEREDLPVAMQYWFISKAFYAITVLLIRLSIGFFILRVCVQKRYIYIIKTTMATMALLTVMYFFFEIFRCSPVKYFWLQFSGASGKCFGPPVVQNVTITYGVFAAISDIIFGVLPLFVIWNLKMNLRAKISVGFLLCLGTVAGLTVFVRIAYIRQFSNTKDFLYATYNIVIWSMIEPCIGIICMAVSTYRPLFKSLRDNSTIINSKYRRNATADNHADSGSIPINAGSQSNFGRSRSGKGGYLKSMESRDTSMEDNIGMKTIAVGPGKGRTSDENAQGILRSTTVEVTRQRRDGNIV